MLAEPFDAKKSIPQPVVRKIALKKNMLSTKSTVALTRGWQCCKCKETMYRDENYCNWCKHTRCNSCRSFQN